MKKYIWPFIALLAIPWVVFSTPPTIDLNATLDPESSGNPISSQFLGLSYESSMLLQKDGKYYFDPQDSALVHTFQTLGIKSLRVGANAVDSPSVPVPQEKDIDSLFAFARAAGLKVIYSFRLKGGVPADSARLAKYIDSNYRDLLDSYSIGNEPNCFVRKYEDYKSIWKPHYDAILAAVPNAMFDGPSTNNGKYEIDWARDFFPGGHVRMASDHFYLFGPGRVAEKDIQGTQHRFLSNASQAVYEAAYKKDGALFASHGIPYRIDEANNCWNGGCKGVSDTYTATLWALDFTHWLAAHHVLGINFHTGESVGMNGGFSAPNYAAFTRTPGGPGFIIHPPGYGYMAFSQSAHGTSIPVTLSSAGNLDFTAYAYKDGADALYITLINKTYGATAQLATVHLNLSQIKPGSWERMDLQQRNQDISSNTGITLGGASVDSNGNWTGTWTQLINLPSPVFTVPPASAAILRCQIQP